MSDSIVAVTDSRFPHAQTALDSVGSLVQVNPSLERETDQLRDAIDGADYLALVGGDALIGFTVDVILDSSQNWPEDGPSLIPVDAPKTSAIGQRVSSVESSDLQLSSIPGRLEAGDLHKVSVESLRVVSSAEPRPHYGFSFGAGVVYEFFEQLQRTGGKLIEQGLSLTKQVFNRVLSDRGGTPTRHRARMSVDRREQQERDFGYLVATSLGESWFGWSAGDVSGTPTVFSGADAEKLLEASIRSSLSFLGLEAGEHDWSRSFDTLHIDWNTGFVLDGRLFDCRQPHAIELRSGPKIPFVSRGD